MPASSPPAISGDDLRAVMQRVPAPVTVVTTAGSAEARGATIGSFTSVSLDPPLVSFNVELESQMHEVLGEASHFAVHLLSDEQSQLCQHFALPDQPGAQQLAEVPHRLNGHGIPVIEEAPAVIHCRLYNTVEAGDHSIIIGKVIRLEVRDIRPPILYYNRDYRGVSGAQ